VHVSEANETGELPKGGGEIPARRGYGAVRLSDLQPRAVRPPSGPEAAPTLEPVSRRDDELPALVDRAMGSLLDPSNTQSASDEIQVLARSLVQRFAPVGRQSSAEDLWAPVNERLNELAAQSKRAEELRRELRKLEAAIDATKVSLVERMKHVAAREQGMLDETEARAKAAMSVVQRLLNWL